MILLSPQKASIWKWPCLEMILAMDTEEQEKRWGSRGLIWGKQAFDLQESLLILLLRKASDSLFENVGIGNRRKTQRNWSHLLKWNRVQFLSMEKRSALFKRRNFIQIKHFTNHHKEATGNWKGYYCISNICPGSQMWAYILHTAVQMKEADDK